MNYIVASLLIKQWFSHTRDTKDSLGEISEIERDGWVRSWGSGRKIRRGRVEWGRAIPLQVPFLKLKTK